MIFCAAGDIHGKMERLYTDIAAFQASLGVRFEHVLHVGDFGVWPNHAKVDKATVKHGEIGDFAEWFMSKRPVPFPTVFIKGNHEDFEWLVAQHSPHDKRSQVIPGLTWLPNGTGIDLHGSDETIRVVGIGGCYGPSDFDRPARTLRGQALRHYTRDECERATQGPKPDIVLLHDAPTGVEIVKPGGWWGEERRYVSPTVGLTEVLERTRPRICFFGHHHARIRTEVVGVPCIGLNLVSRPGYLVAIDMPARSRDWSLLGEWPSA